MLVAVWLFIQSINIVTISALIILLVFTLVLTFTTNKIRSNIFKLFDGAIIIYVSPVKQFIEINLTIINIK